MNSDEIKVDIPNMFTNEKDRLDYMFERQHELASKFTTIEYGHGMLHDTLVQSTEDGEYHAKIPFDLDWRFSQDRIRKFCWYMTEELVEMCNAKNNKHFYEELSDATHFMLELCIITGIPSDKILGRSFHDVCRLQTFWSNFKGPYYPLPLFQYYDGADVLRIIRHLGAAANCLKMKPWKSTFAATDRPKFEYQVKMAFLSLLDLARMTGMTHEEFFKVYYSKSEVNHFRIRTNY